MMTTANGTTESIGVAAALRVIATLAVGAGVLSIAPGSLAQAFVAGLMALRLASLKVPVLKRVLLGIVILEIPIQADIYLNYDAAIARLGAVSGFNVSVATLCLAALYALWMAELVARSTPRTGAAFKSAIPSFVYLALVLASVAIAFESVVAFYEIAILVQAVMLFVYVIHFVKGNGDALFVVVMMVLAMLMQSLIALGVAAIGRPVALGPVEAGLGGRRLIGTFGSPNVLGSYLSLTLPLALGLMLTPTRPPYRWLGGISFGIGAAALALSFSRGAWLGFVAATLIVLVYAGRERYVSITVPILVGIVAIVLAVLLRDEIVTRIAGFEDAAARARLPLMDLSFRMIEDKPILGVGLNNFASAMGEYLTVDFSQDWIYTIHNKYLLVWAETGLVGLAAFGWFLVAALRTGWAAITANNRNISPLALGLWAGVIANMLHMMVEIFHSRPQTQMLWLTVGLIAAMASLVSTNGTGTSSHGAAADPAHWGG